LYLGIEWFIISLVKQLDKTVGLSFKTM
jgi:hypothetical protein